MAKKQKTPDKEKKKPRALIRELTEHFADADSAQSLVRDDWPDKEAILLGNLKDDVSQSVTKSQVFDPRLSTIVFERAARVMAQNPTGKAMAISKDDIGKNKLMNLLLDKWVAQNANHQMDFLIKDRLWDIYSQVYGVSFQLVDWVNDERTNYVGPTSFLLPIRDCFPQPGAISIDECDWFQVSTLKSVQWLSDRDRDEWQNIDELIMKLKEKKGKTRESYDSERRTDNEQKRHTQIPGDSVFPHVELVTEYRRDKWITFAPDFEDVGVLREIANPHKNEKLPIIAKHSFPLLDSIWGLGEIERGKTLQYAINSLINLYLDGVKMSIFPPIQINPNAPGLVPSTIKFGAAEKWLVGKPNVDIQQLQLAPQGIQTFQQTYSFLISALLNQAGTTDTTVTSKTDPGFGKTPQALKLISQRENSRDSWDRFMIERALEARNKLFIELMVEKMDAPVSLRLLESEIGDISQSHPDILEIFDSGRAQVKINKKAIAAKYDYEVEPMSTLKKEPDEEIKNLMFLFQTIMQAPQLLEMMPQQAQQLGKEPMTVDISELFKKIVIASGTQDWDKILVPADNSQSDPSQAVGEQIAQGPQESPQFQDEEIANFAQNLVASTGGIGNVPASPNGITPEEQV